MAESTDKGDLQVNIPDMGSLKKIEAAINYRFGESWNPETRDRLGEHQSISTNDSENRPFAMVQLDKGKWEYTSSFSTFFDLNPNKVRSIRIKAGIHFTEDGKDKWIDYSIELEEQKWKKSSQIVVKGGYLQSGTSFDDSTIRGENKKPLEALSFVDEVVRIANYINEVRNK